jgi:hypothetical protein
MKTSTSVPQQRHCLRSVDAPVNTDTGGTGVPAIFLTTITGFFSRKLPVIFGNLEILEYQDLTEK